VVGRSSKADVRINDKRISREHCAIEVDGDKIFVIDLGGSNGTWVGSHKILANVREPFPQEAVVHVGPAQLRIKKTATQFDPEHDLESRAFNPVTPQPQVPASPAAGAIQPGGEAAALEMVERSVVIGPGERGSIQISITNQGKIVEHYPLSVSGVPGTWVTLPVAGLELLPRQSGTLNVDIHPPRLARTSAGIHPLSIALLDRGGSLITQSSLNLEIESFDNLIIDVRPNPYQSRSGGELLLTVENHGNAETDYRVDVIESSNSLDISIEPTAASVAPQQSRESIIEIRPRKRIWLGDAKRMMMTATVTTSQQSVSTAPVYTQLATIPRWLSILFLLCCCILIPTFLLLTFVVYGGWDQFNEDFRPTGTPTHTSTPENTATATPDLPRTATATHDIWLLQDDDVDGLSNGQEEDLGTNPLSKDTDTDGLTDGDEVTKHDTDPLNLDTDGDTLPDGAEVNDPCKSPNSPDTDLDGVSDNIDPDSCTGITPTPSPVPDFGLGGQVNNSLDNLDVLEDARMTWVKVQLRYGIGADATSAVQDAAQFKEKGFKVLLSVVGNREELARGGGYNQEFAKFLGEIAPVADGLEVWNEPNIQNEWPVGEIDPGDYTELLRASYNAIKAGNPRTLVISAAPAPTGVNDETVMSDDRFIQGMAAAGAAQFMDCVGIHYNQGATSPGDTSGHPDDSTGHYSYYYMPMIDLYYDTFKSPNSASGIPLCFTEIGFLSADGFDQTLAQVGATNFRWAEGTSVRDQAEWLEEALLDACRSGKVKLFIVWNVGFTNYGEDPQAGFSILRPDEDCDSCETLSRAVGTLRMEGCMQ
jgi:hypothetical protein